MVVHVPHLFDRKYKYGDAVQRHPLAVIPFSGGTLQSPSSLINNMKVEMPHSGALTFLIKNMNVGMPFSGAPTSFIKYI